MRMLPIHRLAALALCAAGPVLAQTPAGSAPGDVPPGARREGVVHVNAMKNPEMHTYRAVVAGMDMFDEQHALAPAVPRLQFAVSARNGAPLTGELPTVKLFADDFTLALPLDADGRLTVPRSQQAWDSKAELVMNRKRKTVRVWPWIHTPGLADNQRRLGDVRLECRVIMAVAKEEAPFWAVALVNSVLLTGDWCSFMKDRERSWSVTMPGELASATLIEGNRSAMLKVKGNAFEVPLSDPTWGNDALIEVTYAALPAPDGLTRTAGETPRTGP
jgi:hypothetical protein